MANMNKQKDDEKVFYKDKRYQGFAVVIVGTILMIVNGGNPDPVAAQTFVDQLSAHIGEIVTLAGAIYGWGANWYERVFK